MDVFSAFRCGRRSKLDRDQFSSDDGITKPQHLMMQRHQQDDFTQAILTVAAWRMMKLENHEFKPREKVQPAPVDTAPETTATPKHIGLDIVRELCGELSFGVPSQGIYPNKNCTIEEGTAHTVASTDDEFSSTSSRAFSSCHSASTPEPVDPRENRHHNQYKTCQLAQHDGVVDSIHRLLLNDLSTVKIIDDSMLTNNDCDEENSILSKNNILHVSDGSNEEDDILTTTRQAWSVQDVSASPEMTTTIKSNNDEQHEHNDAFETDAKPSNRDIAIKSLLQRAAHYLSELKQADNRVDVLYRDLRTAQHELLNLEEEHHDILQDLELAIRAADSPEVLNEKEKAKAVSHEISTLKLCLYFGLVLYICNCEQYYAAIVLLFVMFYYYYLMHTVQ